MFVEEDFFFVVVIVAAVVVVQVSGSKAMPPQPKDEETEISLVGKLRFCVTCVLCRVDFDKIS